MLHACLRYHKSPRPRRFARQFAPAHLWRRTRFLPALEALESRFVLTGLVLTPPPNQTEVEDTRQLFSLGSFTDSGSGPWKVDVNWRDGSADATFTVAAPGSLGSLAHQFGDQPSPRDVTVTVTEERSPYQSASADFQVTILDVQPVITSFQVTPKVIDENGNVRVTGSFTNLPKDTAPILIDWGDGTSSLIKDFQQTNTGGNFSATHKYLGDPGPGGSTFAASVKVTDQQHANSFDTATALVTVHNVAPSNVRLNLASGTIDEGSTAVLSGSFTDPGTLDTHTVVIDWGDGSATTTLNLPAGVLSFSGVSHRYLDNRPGNAPYPITATVTDDDGASGAGSTSVTVNNVAPTDVNLDLAAPTINEGGTASLSGSFTDPGPLDTHTVVIDWGDGSPATTLSLAAGVLSFSGVSHRYLDNQPGNAPYSIRTTVTDDDGASGSGSAALKVLNVAPMGVGLGLAQATIDEGGTATLSGNFADPGPLDTHTVVIDWGDGSAPTNLSLPAGILSFNGVSHQYVDNRPGNAPYTISATITDSDGASGSGSTALTVLNVAPSGVSLSLAQATIEEGGTATLTGSFTDPGTLDAHTLVIDWGDGSSATSVNLPAGVLSFPNLSHKYLDNQPGNAPYTVSATVTDSDGASGSGSAALTVLNVAPSGVSLDLTKSTIDEGGTATLSGSFSDPGPLDTHSVVIDWGDGSTPTTFSLPAGVLSFTDLSHQYLDNRPGNARYAISATVTDDDGASGSGSAPLTVLNVAPSGVSLGLTASTIGEGGTATLSGSFADPGVLDTHTVVIDWGDGSATSTLSLPAGVLSFTNLSHQYLDNRPTNAPYTISATVTDSDGAIGTGSAALTVLNVAPSGVSLDLTKSTIEEGGTATLSGSFSDPGSLDTHSVIINWGDGSSPTTLSLPAGVLSFTNLNHQYLENRPGNAPYTISAIVTDGDGDSSSGSAPLTVLNVAPSGVSLGLTASTIDEGGTATLSGSFTDPGVLDTHTVIIDWGDGSAATTLSLAPGVLSFGNLSHQYLENKPGNAPYTIRATVTDGDGATGSGSAALTVLNVAPSGVSLSLTQSTIDEGGTTTLSGSFTDPGTLDAHAVVIDWGDGSTPTTLNLPAGVGSFSGQSHQYLDNLLGDTPYTISATISDDDGAHAAGSAAVTVRNVAPSDVNLHLTAPAIDEGGTGTLSGGFTDPGTLDTHTVVIDWGDGSPATTLNLPAGVLSFSGQAHQYLDNNPGDAPFTIRATVTDGDGASSSSTANLTVRNVAPSGMNLDLGAPTIDEGGTAKLSGSFTDPGVLDTHTVMIDWGDGSPTSTLSLAPGVLSFSNLSHQYLDNKPGNGPYTIRGTVTDSDGASATATTAFTVLNVAPSAVTLNLAAATLNEGDTATLSGNFTDPGTLDTHKVLIDWGDGSTPTALSLPAGVLSFSGQAHQYLDSPATAPSSSGQFTIRVTVSDQDGGSAAADTAVTVRNLSPVLTINGASAVQAGATYTLDLGAAVTGSDAIEHWTISWGDGSPVQSIEASPSSVTHVYTNGPNLVQISATATNDDGTFAAGNTVAVTVKIAKLANFADAFVAPGQTVGVMIPGPDGTPLVEGALTHAAGSNGNATWFVGTYNGNPNKDSDDTSAGILFHPPDGSTLQLNALSFFDVRVDNAGAGDVAVVSFAFAGNLANAPVVGFFDPATQAWHPLRGSAAAASTLVVDPVTHVILAGQFQGQILDPTTLLIIDPVAHRITVILDGTSSPALHSLGGTIFTLAVPVSQPTAATVSPPLALAAPRGADTSAFNSTTTLVNTTQATFVLNVSETISGATSQGTVSTPTVTGDTETGTDDDNLDKALNELWQWLGTPEAQQPPKAKPAAPKGKEPVHIKPPSVQELIRLNEDGTLADPFEWLFGASAKVDRFMDSAVQPMGSPAILDEASAEVEPDVSLRNAVAAAVLALAPGIKPPVGRDERRRTQKDAP
jgi:hypothetical protein